MKSNQYQTTSFRKSCFGLLSAATVAVVVLVSVAWMIGGRTFTEKILTELVSPVGMVWFLLALFWIAAFLQGQLWTGWQGLGIWLLLTLGGNYWVANQLIAGLESDFQLMDPFQAEPLERLVLLGGGTSSRVSGAPQLSMSGDRVALAAQLYHAGQVNQIICSGSNSFQPSEDSLHCREEARQILIRLGVPADAIVLIEGANTSEEIANLSKFMAQHAEQSPQRIGILTSAWHLPRAMRSAQRHRLEVTPVPADFRSEPFRLNPNLIVPGATELNSVRSTIKEHLGRLLGR